MTRRAWTVTRRRTSGWLAAALLPAALGGRAPAAEASPSFGIGEVYAMTNAPAGNAIAVFRRSFDGSLTPAGTVATGGLGTGAGLGNQGAIHLTDDGRWLFAVNAASDDFSVFRVRHGSLTLTSRVPSAGARPISVTAHRQLVYVLNAGGAGSISGFTLSAQGMLAALPGATRPLSSGAANPAQVSFSPSGDALVVTEKATNILSVYRIAKDGLASPPIPHPSSGMTPFGFAFDPFGRVRRPPSGPAGLDLGALRNERLLVSEAFPGVANGSATSAYRLTPDGHLSVVDASVPTLQTAACWLVITGDGRFAYVANAGSGSVTGYRIGSDGRLTRLDEDGVTASLGAGSSPIDIAVDRLNRNLYVLSSGADHIRAFAIHGDGGLTPVPADASLPDGANGLAAR